MIEYGYVVKKEHATYNLCIYNYTAAAQYDQVWNEVTLACRGLIMDSELNIIARPFTKFFNLGESINQVIPNEPFEVWEKMDGSLGILYWVNDRPAIATRGSFESRQAIKATALLHSKYKASIDKLDRSKTYLFEIIYPENRIVLNYGNKEYLCLLAIIDNKSGKDQELVDIGFPLVKKYNGVEDISSLKATEEENREGYVIKYANGFRLKVKFDEYLRIHKIVTQISSIDIWKHLSTDEQMIEILEKVPDEFYTWAKKTEQTLKNAFDKIEQVCLSEFKEFTDRKAAASYYLGCTYPKILFSMLDKRDYSKIIWKLIKPVHERPFTAY